jgi:RimJ/RimL family protein N-acetyltransferase
MYPLFDVRVVTPRLELRGATDDLLERLSPAVRGGKADAEPAPFDDPMSLYEHDPDVRVRKWLQAIWRMRGSIEPDLWRLYFVVMLEGAPVGMQDLIGSQFPTFGTVFSFSWLSSDVRQRGLGTEMRAAVLHLAFSGLNAKEAHSEAFFDNDGSNRVSERLGYRPNGITWATRRGQPAQLHRWRLTHDDWQRQQRDDIELHGLENCRATLGIQPTYTG